VKKNQKKWTLLKKYEQKIFLDIQRWNANKAISQNWSQEDLQSTRLRERENPAATSLNEWIFLYELPR